MIEKTFYQIFIEINTDVTKAQKAFEDKRLTIAEKKIIEAFLLIRDNKNIEATELLSTIANSPLPLVEAIKKLLIGLALNNQSQFQEAEKEFLEVLPKLKKLNCHYHEFITYFNLFIIYLNNGSIDKAGETIKQMEKVPLDSELQIFRLKRCQLDYYVETDNVQEAYNIINFFKQKRTSIPESDIIPYLMTQFILYIKEDKFQDAQVILSGMKKHRKFHLTENFNFMKKLLENIIHDSPIYINNDSFVSTPVLDHQIRVISFLEELNKEEAHKHWNALIKFSPEIYKENFNYTGQKCLFSVCLAKHLKKNQTTPQTFKSDNLSQSDSILDILRKSKSPLHKSFLYEFIWGAPPLEKDDYKKLSRLITKIRAEKGVDIIYKKSTYSIAEKPLK